MLKRKLSLLALPLVAAVSLQAQSPFNDPFFQDPFGDDIFKEMMQMQRQMDEMFQRMQQRINQRATRLVHPSMGMYKLTAQSEFIDKGDHYEMVTNIPESKENHIDIHTQNGMITISAKIVHEEKQTTNGMVSTSRSIQSFQQSTSLPSDADENNIKSEFKDGRLIISIGKKASGTMAKPVVPTTAQAPVQPTNNTTEPAFETLKLPSANHENKEKSLPAIKENLKKVQPASLKPAETNDSEPAKKVIGDKDSIS